MAPPGARVLFVQGAGVRAGAERALLGRLRHLSENEIVPLVAFLAEGPFRAEIERTGVPTVLVGEAPRARHLSRLPAVIAKLASVARGHRADVIEGCGEKMSLLAGWAARVAGCAAVYNLQDAPRRDGGATLVQLAAATGRHDAVVVPSRWMAGAFRRPFRIEPRVIPNAVVLDDLPRKPADVRQIAGWRPEATVVGLFGRMVAWKGGEVLLRAAHHLRAGAGELHFLIVGGTLYGHEPEYPHRLRDLARELAMLDRVRFTGHREDALELMAGCDIVCHCSVGPEPFGVVVVEGMALGKAVIATRSGGPEEIIQHSRTGILVHPGDHAALAAELAGLAGDPARRAELGTAARVAARHEFASGALAGRLVSLYRELAAARLGCKARVHAP